MQVCLFPIEPEEAGPRGLIYFCPFELTARSILTSIDYPLRGLSECVRTKELAIARSDVNSINQNV